MFLATCHTIITENKNGELIYNVIFFINIIKNNNYFYK